MAVGDVRFGRNGQRVEQVANGVMVDGTLWYGHTIDTIAGANPELFGAPAGAPGTGGGTADAGARGDINATLARYGLAGLGDWAWQQYLSGIPIEQILLDMRQRPEYKTRFPYMEALAKKGRAISEAGAIELERTYAQIAQSFGLPKGFYDSPDDFAGWIVTDVSPTELRDRLDVWRSVADEDAALPENAPVMAELQRLYGITGGSGSFLALTLDPTKALPIMERQVRSARISGAAIRTGFGSLDRTEAEGLDALGVTREQATAGFGQLAQVQGVFTNLPGEIGQEVTRTEQFGATFSNNQAAAERIRRRQRGRVTPFEAGGGFATDREGISGLATADR